MSNAPNAPAGQQDFIKGWPHPSMLDRAEFKTALQSSFTKALGDLASSALNYGTKEEGAFMLGHPTFLNALAGFLSSEYGRPVDPRLFVHVWWNERVPFRSSLQRAPKGHYNIMSESASAAMTISSGSSSVSSMSGGTRSLPFGSVCG